MNAETENKIQKLQLLEQQIQNLSLQKQNLQTQLSEINSALTALKGKDSAYKIIGNLMILCNAKDLHQDLNNKSKIFNLQISTLEKHEMKINEKAQKIQKEVMNEMGDESEE